jgi:hypothetical protein
MNLVNPKLDDVKTVLQALSREDRNEKFEGEFSPRALDQHLQGLAAYRDVYFLTQNGDDTGYLLVVNRGAGAH